MIFSHVKNLFNFNLAGPMVDKPPPEYLLWSSATDHLFIPHINIAFGIHNMQNGMPLSTGRIATRDPFIQVLGIACRITLLSTSQGWLMSFTCILVLQGHFMECATHHTLPLVWSMGNILGHSCSWNNTTWVGVSVHSLPREEDLTIKQSNKKRSTDFSIGITNKICPWHIVLSIGTVNCYARVILSTLA
jgi:hypothetical protein